MIKTKFEIRNLFVLIVVVTAIAKEKSAWPLFNNKKTFTGSGTNGLYEFNTYRAGYRYRFVQKPKLIFDVGLSLLVRDARIAISQNDQNYKNIFEQIFITYYIYINLISIFLNF